MNFHSAIFLPIIIYYEGCDKKRNFINSLRDLARWKLPSLVNFVNSFRYKFDLERFKESIKQGIFSPQSNQLKCNPFVSDKVDRILKIINNTVLLQEFNLDGFSLIFWSDSNLIQFIMKMSLFRGFLDRMRNLYILLLLVYILFTKAFSDLIRVFCFVELFHSLNRTN